MKKTVITALMCVLFCVCLCVPVQAAGSTQEEIWYADVWDAIDGQTRDLLSDIGITPSVADTLADVNAKNVFSVITRIFKGQTAQPLSAAFIVLAVLVAVAFFSSFLGDGKLKELTGNAGTLSIVFLLMGLISPMISSCVSAIELSKDFMLSLIPVLTAVVAFSGNPALALSFNTVVFSFAQSISVLYANLIPSFAAVGCAFSASTAINPMMKLSKLSQLVFKAATFIMSFISGIFVAVLSVRGVIAGAADTVTIRGLRFLIGSSVPVVGSAIADALNSVVAGVGLIKNTIGVIGIAATLFINLPVLCEIIVWKTALYILGIFCDILSEDNISSFLSTLNSVFSVLTAVICFNMFVFIISIAIIFTVKTSGG